MTLEEAKEFVRVNPETFKEASKIYATSTGCFYLDGDLKTIKGSNKGLEIFIIKGEDTLLPTEENGII